MSTPYFDQQFVGAFVPPKPVPGDRAELAYRNATEASYPGPDFVDEGRVGRSRRGEAGLGYSRSQMDLSLSHGKAVTRVGVAYTIEDGGGIGEVTYLYPLDTLVVVAPGRVLPVQFLRPGMTFLLEDGGVARVTSVDEPRVLEAPTREKNNNGNSLRRVLGTVKWTGNFPHFDLSFDDGDIPTTPGHPFWCLRRKAWIPACEFQAGDLMRSQDGRPIRVRSVRGIYWEHGSLYNLEIEDDHNYFVGDLGGTAVWSHNGLGMGCRVPKAAVVEAASARHAAWGSNLDAVSKTMAQLGERALRQSGGNWRTSEQLFERYLKGVSNRLAKSGSPFGVEIQPAALRGGERVPALIYLHRGGWDSPLITDRHGNPQLFAFPGSGRLDAGIFSTAAATNDYGLRPIVAGFDISLDQSKPKIATYYQGFFGAIPIYDIRLRK